MGEIMSVSIINRRITVIRGDACYYVQFPHREMLQIQRKPLYIWNKTQRSEGRSKRWNKER